MNTLSANTTSQSRIRSPAPLKRGAIDKEISFCSNTRCCDKTSPPQSLPLSGKTPSGRREMSRSDRGRMVARRRRDGEVVQSSTCVIPLTLKASFVQPLSLASARQLPYQGSPWQRGFVSDETKWSGCEIIENVTARQSLPLSGEVASSEAKMTERF